MPLSHTIQFAALKELQLDPRNPRLGFADTEPPKNQEHVLKLMQSWNLEELAVSFLANGFWPQEAVIVVNEPLYGQPHTLVVVEGNRRIAALTYLKLAFEGSPSSRTWHRMVDGVTPDNELFSRIPYILADSRADVTAYLGFRHVTGIKQWDPAQKAAFIANMIDEMGMSYDTVRKEIGMRVDTVRRNYIAYRMIKQMETLDIEVSEEGVEKRFSVLYLSLREERIRSFLDINIRAETEGAKSPVPQAMIRNLSDFARWLFGTNDQRPLFSDSRYVGDFARILSNTEAVDYLRSSAIPSFDVALQKAGVEDEEIENQLKEANTQMELALSRIHLHLDSQSIRKAMERLALNAKELLSKFPSVAEKVGLRTGDGNDA
ncbi:MAG: hypothetical protein F4Y80_06170 [Caldilineaceae bacterium SB0665_bin_21]|nr:hypothetical protein [Caldilineaceae bacterium SB0665_bin_21]